MNNGDLKVDIHHAVSQGRYRLQRQEADLRPGPRFTSCLSCHLRKQGGHMLELILVG